MMPGGDARQRGASPDHGKLLRDKSRNRIELEDLN
jgi:hypothetical protein